MKILVIVEGGVVTEVRTNIPAPIKVTVLDMDDVDVGQTIELPGGSKIDPSMAFDEIDEVLKSIYPYKEM
jgi:hypothetical protein